MKRTGLKREVENELAVRFGQAIGLRGKPRAELLPFGIPELDALVGGLVRGGITEVAGPESSGKTSVLLASLAHATARDEVCALIDAGDAFDPAAAAGAGTDLDRLLWVRCSGNIEHAMRAADMLLHGGGFGLVALDLAGAPVSDARRIPMSYWFRLRRAIEKSPTCLLVISEEPSARSCAALTLEIRRESAVWSRAMPVGPALSSSKLLRGFELAIERNRPVNPGKNRTRVFGVRRPVAAW